MYSNAPDAHQAQAPAPNKPAPRLFRPFRIQRVKRTADEIRRQRKCFNIRIARAAALIGRRHISVKAACRALRLESEKAEKFVARLCDERGIRFRTRAFQIDPIKAQRAIFEVARGRGRCTVAAACRAAGFEGREARCAELIVAVLCDERGIARPRSSRVLLPALDKNQHISTGLRTAAHR
jgi:hypothetical protein